MKKHNFVIVIVLLLTTLIVSHAIPKPQYSGTGFISKLEIPYSVGDWYGKDITSSLDLDFDKDWNKFISEALIYQYLDKKGKDLLFIILDAGNFHNPNACFTASGYEIEELANSEFTVQGQTIKAHTIFTTKGNKTGLSFYWIIIDKKIVNNWVEQKFKQLYYSLFNRSRVGLMIRFDIPAKKETIQDATMIANQFIINLYENLNKEQAAYIFGQ